jgi:O-antigen ligase
MAAVGTFEALIGLGQAAKGGEIGLGPLEVGGFFYRFGTSTASRAGLPHPYHLACFLLVALAAALLGTRGTLRDQAPWLVAAGVCATCVATTYSRAGLLSIAAIVLFGAIGPRDEARRKAVRLMAGVIAVGFIIGAVSFGNGWWTRSQSAQTGQIESVDSGRTERAKEALRLVDAHPVTGVGPGRYVIALETVKHQKDILLPAHNVVLHVAAEAGVVGGLLMAALGLALVVRYARAGAFTMAVFMSLAFFFVLDAYPYVFPSGLALAGLWLGFVESARTEARESRAQLAMAT